MSRSDFENKFLYQIRSICIDFWIHVSMDDPFRWNYCEEFANKCKEQFKNKSADFYKKYEEKYNKQRAKKFISCAIIVAAGIIIFR